MARRTLRNIGLAVSFMCSMLCVGNARADAPVIRIAVPDISAGPKPAGSGVVDVLYTRHQLEDEFKKDGVEVRWIFLKGAGPAVNEALANHQVDLAFLGDLAGIIGRANGLDTRLIAALTRNSNAYLGVASGLGVHTLQDLKGKQIAIWRGTAVQLSFDNVLRTQGLTERDFRIVNLDLGAAPAALAAHRIDAAWGSSGLYVLKDKGLIDIPVSTRELNGVGTYQAGLIATQDFLHAHPDWTVRILRHVVEGQRWLSDHRNLEAFLKLESEQGNFPDSVWRSELSQADLQANYSPLLDTYFVDSYKHDVDTAKQLGVIRHVYDVDQWVDRSYLDNALHDTGLAGYWKPYRAYGQVDKSS
jgi:sulfonate transport system substrate-binding protein